MNTNLATPHSSSRLTFKRRFRRVHLIKGRPAHQTVSLVSRYSRLRSIEIAPGIGLTNGVIAVGIVFSPQIARLVRARALVVRQELYVDAARCLGASNARILWRHVLPNAIQPVIVQVTLLLAGALLAEASLSFLGLGIQPPNPSWGSMLARAYQNMEIAPAQMYPPGLAILLTALAFNSVDNYCLRDHAVLSPPGIKAHGQYHFNRHPSARRRVHRQQGCDGRLRQSLGVHPGLGAQRPARAG